jgi:hypothetical protein
MLGTGVYWEEHVFWVLLTLAWIVSLAIHSRQVWWLPAIERRVLSYGQITSGVVIDRRSTSGKAGPRLWVTFAYDVDSRHGGGQRHGEMRTHASAYEVFAPESPVTVFYDPRNPRRAIAYELSDFVIMGP